MSSKKRMAISFSVFILMISLFMFTAKIEYQRSYQNQIKVTQDRLLVIKLNLESLVLSRLNIINGVKALIETTPNFSQLEFNHIVMGVYEAQNSTIQSISFLKDTTVTHIYPYETLNGTAGNNFNNYEDCKSDIDFVKENKKPIITSPTKLPNGKIGFTVRAPIIINSEYYGQLSIAFDYEKTFKLSGLHYFEKDYYIQILRSDKTNPEFTNIWSNFINESIDMSDLIKTEAEIYGSKLLMYAVPKSGITGKSDLFYSIIVIGSIIAMLTGLGVNMAISTTTALARSDLQLKRKNEILEDMVIQLKENEKELYIQYDEISKQKEQIEYMADFDFLTNLYNRKRFSQDVSAAIKQKQRGTIILIDIDNFKNINDTQGHQYGDRVIKHLGSVLKEILCEEVVVYRIGGDEFAVHLPEITEPEKIEEYINTIYHSLKSKGPMNQVNNYLTASIGIARYPDDSDCADDLLMKSDIAMYAAKDNGKNRYCYFTESLFSKFDYYVKIEKVLQTALEENKFIIHYQPIINTMSGKIESLEALLRIKDSMISPAEFIPIAESSGVILSIGRWVINEVCFQLNSWMKCGFDVKPISINISVKQIYDDEIFEYIKDTLHKYNLNPSLIEIEVTESLLIQDSDQAIKLLQKLREYGVRISLDDFGTGYSSFRYLTFMPVDKVKIDKSLKDKFLFMDGSVIMKGIISICHGLKMKIVTEGVETIEEFQKLKHLGSDYVQGYYFDKPLSTESIAGIFNKNYLIENDIGKESTV